MALSGLVISVSGSLTTPSVQLGKLVRENGGTFSAVITASVTHLITTADEVKASTYKVSTADKNGALLVTEKWLLDSLKAKTKLDEKPYLISKDIAPSTSYFATDIDFLSEAELAEEMQKEETRRKALNDLYTSSKSEKQSTANSPSINVSGSPSSFGFAQPSTTGFSNSSSFGFSSSQSSSQGSQFGFSKSDVASSNSTSSSSVGMIYGRERRKPVASSRGIAPKVKAWADNDGNKPSFPEKDFEVDYFDTLQWTDVNTNHNKYYCIEFHVGKEANGKERYRLYTHYGRTDDLVKKPGSGRRENRFYSTIEEADDAYAALIEEKTITKGYRKVELLFSNVGSDKLRLLMSEMSKQRESQNSTSKSSNSSNKDSFVDLTPLTTDITDLVTYIYDEASAALNNTLGPAKITSLGIETPLGVVNMNQIDKGEAILTKLYEMFKSGIHNEDTINDLTNQFYTMIPHNLGRNRAQISSTKIASMAAFEEKQDLLQLMRDMLNVTAEGKTLGASDIDMKYRALRTKIEKLEEGSEKFEDVKRIVLESQVDKEDLIRIKRIFSVTKPQERASFSTNRVQSNQHTLFHGSRISNYVGLLSRGLLMPKMVVAMGGKRRDAGLLGNGIYFGDSASTSAQYCTPGSKGTRLMLLNNVALGNVKDYEKVVFGLMEPPTGFNSVHGVRSTPEHKTDFKDNEYVIFNAAQQYQEYLVEFELKRELEEFVTSQIFHNEDGTSSVQKKDSRSVTPSLKTKEPKNNNDSANESVSEKTDEITSTVDDIFANLLTPSTTSSTTSSKLSSASMKARLGSQLGKTSTTFGTSQPYSSLLNQTSNSTFGSTAPLKLKPSNLQTSLLNPTTSSATKLGSSFGSSFGASSGSSLAPSSALGFPSTSSFGLQPSSSLGSSLKLQPSGLKTSVKVGPLSTSFGRKSAGSSSAEEQAQINAIQLPSIDPTLETGAAAGAAALLAAKKDPEEMTEEEKELKRKAMRMGGKNWGSKATSSTEATTTPVVTSNFNSYGYSTYGSDITGYETLEQDQKKNVESGAAQAPVATSHITAKGLDLELDSYRANKPSTAPVATSYTTTAESLDLELDRAFMGKRTVSEMESSSNSSMSAALHPHKRQKVAITQKPNILSATSAKPIKSKQTPLSSTQSTYKTTLLSDSSGSGFKPLSASGKPISSQLNDTSSNWRSSFLGNSLTTLSSSSVSSSSAGGSGRVFPSVRTTVTSQTPQSKLSLFLGKEILKQRTTESKIRDLFTTDRNSLLLKDYVQLTDVFKHRETFRNAIETEEEKSIPKILTRNRYRYPIVDKNAKDSYGSPYDSSKQGDYCVVDKETFRNNFNELTNSVFASLDFKNIIVSGGIVLGSLYMTPEGHHVGNDPSLSLMYRDCDIEIGFYGLDSASCTKKLQEVFFAVQSATKASCEIIRTSEYVMIVGQYPIRNIKIALRQFKSPAEILMGIDVDCSAIGYDGNTVYSVSRAHRALTKRYNLVDLSLKNLTYEVALFQFAKRGFAVAVPGFQRQLVTPHLYLQKPWQVRGLAKLLLLEQELNSMPNSRPNAERLSYEPWMPRNQCFAVYSKDDFSIDRIHAFQAKQKDRHMKNIIDDIDSGIEQEDNSILFVPWGPQWRTSRVVKQLSFSNAAFYRFTKMIIQNMENNDSSNQLKTTVSSPKRLVLFGMDSVVNGTVPESEPAFLEDQEAPKVSKFDAESLNDVFDCIKKKSVEGPIVWSPTPSKPIEFNPIDDETWYSEAYCVSDTPVEMIHCITDLAFAGINDQLNAIIRKLPRNFELDRVSPYENGRSALVYACIQGNNDAISALISKGANPTAIDPTSGLSPLHFAAYSGNATAIETLLRNASVDINIKSRNERWTPLHFAAFYGHKAALLTILQDTKIRINPRDKARRTPTFLAAYAGQIEALEILKSHGAKMNTEANIDENTTITALQIASKRGHEKVRSFLIEVLKPEFPPALSPNSEALAALNNQFDVSVAVDASSSDTTDQVKTADPKDVSDWSYVDKYGQNLLHYAVKHCEVALVRQITNWYHQPGQKVDLLVPVPSELLSLNLIELNAENAFGQTALYYAQQLLDQFNDASSNPTSVESISFVDSERHKKLNTIIRILKSVGAHPAHLTATRAIPSFEDNHSYQIMQKLAKSAKAIVKKIETEIEQREQELRLEEDKAFKATRAAIRRKISNELPGGKKTPPASPSLNRSHRHHLTGSGRRGMSQVGPGFAFSSPSNVPPTLKEFSETNDVSKLLVAVVQMHASKQINSDEKMILKSLALKGDRMMFAALKAFQTDHVSLAFGNTLQQIAKIHSTSR